MTAAPIHFVAAVEQYDPASIVRLAALADQHGFAGTVLSDRFQPWLPTQGNASFVWAIAGAIGQRTSGSVAVSAVPGYRSHPAVIAQASATLASLYPGRHRLMLSSGDAIDEHVVGEYWPEPQERAARLFEAADVIRKLYSASLKGNDTRHSGAHFRLETARLWTMPQVPPPVQVWAGGPMTARRAGRDADGIVVQSGPAERLAAVLAAYRESARESGRSRESTLTSVHVQLAWGASDAEAERAALREWPMAGLRFPRGDIRSPFDVDQLVRSVTVDDVRTRMPVSADPDVHRDHLQSFLNLGFDTVHVHNVGRNQEEWVDVFGRDILPRLRR